MRTFEFENLFIFRHERIGAPKAAYPPAKAPRLDKKVNPVKPKLAPSVGERWRGAGAIWHSKSDFKDRTTFQILQTCCIYILAQRTIIIKWVNYSHDVITFSVLFGAASRNYSSMKITPRCDITLSFLDFIVNVPQLVPSTIFLQVILTKHWKKVEKINYF